MHLAAPGGITGIALGRDPWRSARLGQGRRRDRARVTQFRQDLAGRGVGAFGACHLHVLREIGDELLAAVGGERRGFTLDGTEVVAYGIGRGLHAWSPVEGGGVDRKVSTASRKPGQTRVNSSSAARPLSVSA